MQTNHSSSLRGLSIATIVVAGLGILACIIGFIALAIGGGALASVTPDMLDYYDYDYDYGYYGYDGDDIMAFLVLMLGFGGVALFWELACSVVGLLAGIFGLRFHDKPEKLNLVFGWSLAGAIASLLCGNIVAVVLLVLVCVFSYKDKQVAAGVGAAAPAVVPAANAVVCTAPAPAPAAQPTTAAQAAQPAAAPAVQPVAQPASEPQPAPELQPASSEQPTPAPTANPEATTPPDEPKSE